MTADSPQSSGQIPRLRTAGLVILIAVLSVVYWQGVAGVPFHPDESTQIFMSSDVEIFAANPTSLFWSAAGSTDLRQHYRELDAPLTRYLIGLGRALIHQPALAADWDWSASWDDNAALGALPGSALLLVSRYSTAWLFPFSLLLIFAIGRRLNGELTGWLALLLLAGSALVLLHTRRAMAESALLFSSLLAIWVFMRRPVSPLLMGVCAALAFCAKQSSLVFLPLAALILLAQPHPHRRVLQAAGALLQLGAAFTVITFLLNPFLWSNPIAAARSALTARQGLLSRQMEGLRAVNPEKVLSTPGDRLAGLTANLFFLEPAVEDIANYTQDLALSRSGYLSNPLHTLLRSLSGGAAQLALTLLGLALAIRFALLRSNPHREAIWIVLGVFIITLAALWVSIPLPFQRYVIPLLPSGLLLQAFAASQLVHAVSSSIQKKTGED